MNSEDKSKDESLNTPQFRTEALNHLINSQSHYQPVQINCLAEQLILIPITFLIIYGICWGFLGSVSSWAEGKGILLPTEENLYTATLQEGSGKLENYLIKVEESVKEQQPIAKLSNQLLNDQIAAGRAYIKKLEESYNQEKKQSEQEIMENHNQTEEQKKPLKETIKIINKYLEFLKHNASQIEKVKGKGIVPLSRIEQLAESTKNAQESIDNNKVQLLQKDIDEKAFVAKWDVRLKDLEQKIKAEKYENEKLVQQLKAMSEITSPVDGSVVVLNKTKGDLIKKGDAVAIISTKQGEIDATIFLSPLEGEKVKVGMTALVTPNTVKREEFGGIYATVTYVSSMPVNQDRMIAILQNENLVKTLVPNNQAAIEVRARLKRDPETYSGFAWSSSSGPQQDIKGGLLVGCRISVKQQSPFSLLIPALKKLKGE